MTRRAGVAGPAGHPDPSRSPVYPHIGCCLDGAPADGGAARVAIGLCGEGGRLSLIHVSAGPRVDPAAWTAADERDPGWDTSLEEMARRIPGATAVRLEGGAGPAICRWAADEACDLLVVSSRQPGPWGMSVLGGVTRHVLDNAPCPVLVVRRSPPAPDPA